MEEAMATMRREAQAKLEALEQKMIAAMEKQRREIEADANTILETRERQHEKMQLEMSNRIRELEEKLVAIEKKIVSA